MNNASARIAFSICCSLTMSFIAIMCAGTILDFRGFAAASQSTADTQSAKPSLEKLVVVLRSKGADEPMSAHGAERLGFSPEILPCKQIHISSGAGIRSAETFEANGHTYILLLHNEGNSKLAFLLHDSGEIIKGFSGQKGSNMQPMPFPDAERLVPDERGYWLTWLANGAQVPDQSKKN
jgi:hypothetical protein